MQTYLDGWVPVKTTKSSRIATEKEDARPARLLRLLPVGFPIKETHRNYFVNIDNEELFELYAREQWMGNTVVIGDYIFDQRVIPDFAYKVVGVIPSGPVNIGEGTKFKVEKEVFKKTFNSNNTAVGLEDVVGHSQVKKKCKILIQYLEDPELFGQWAPKNVLFYGAPGTGKTMTARALANEVNARFLLIRATDLVGEFVGDGSKRIHDLYSSASDSTPTVVFIDELDAIALDRSFQSVRGDVSEVVNALLSELDGIKENVGVVTIAATNNTRLLDSAIRSRFEEELEFKTPSKLERLEILKHYAGTLPLPIKVDFSRHASKTVGFSGRDLKEKLLKAALYKAILENSGEITDNHLDAALNDIKPDTQKPPGEMFT